MTYPKYRVWTKTETQLLEYLWNWGIGQDQDELASAMSLCFPSGQGYSRPHQIYHRIDTARTEAEYDFAPLVSGKFRPFRSGSIMECIKTIWAFHIADTRTKSMDEKEFLKEIKEEDHFIIKYLDDDMILWMIRNSGAFGFHRWPSTVKENLIALFTAPKSPVNLVRGHSDLDLVEKMRHLTAGGSPCSEKTVRHFLLGVISENCRSEAAKAILDWYDGKAMQDESSNETLKSVLERLNAVRFMNGIEQ